MGLASPASSANGSNSFSNGPTPTSTACRSFMQPRERTVFRRGIQRPGPGLGQIRSGHMEIRSELEIAAPAAEVWGILTDFPRYQEWNPFITELKSDGIVGNPLQLSLSLPEGRDHRLKATLLRMEEDFELRWRAH